MDARLKRYYFKKMNGGRSLLARIMDFILLRAAILVTIFLTMLQLSHSIRVAAPVAILITAAFSIAVFGYRRKKAEQFYKEDMHRVREKCLLESLTLMSEDEYIEYMKSIYPGIQDAKAIPGGFQANRSGARLIILHNHPGDDVGVSQVVEAYRLCKDIPDRILISLSDFNDEAKKFAESMALTLMPGTEVLRAAEEKGMLPDEKNAEDRAKKEMAESAISLERVRRSAFSRTKVRAYIICGLAALAWPLLGIWRFYYPIISAVCFALAFISYRKGKQSEVRGQ